MDYKRLSPDEIATLLTSAPDSDMQQLTEVFEGVDGRDVADMEQILHPGPELRPPPLLDDESKNSTEEENFATGRVEG